MASLNREQKQHDETDIDNNNKQQQRQRQEWQSLAKAKRDQRDKFVDDELHKIVNINAAATTNASLENKAVNDDNIQNYFIREGDQEGDNKDNVIEIISTTSSSLSSFLSQLDIEITSSTSLKALLENIANSTWSSEHVVRAFCKRALIAQKLANCCTEFCFDAAIKRAQQLDSHLKETGRTVGPLHGLPISFKDQIDIKDVENTLCYVSRIGKISTENAVIVDLLIKQGAIPYLKTNMPQTVMSAESVNHIFGSTLNPFNRKLSSGGSSGGEGALIALKGSILGIGTDIAGSIRIPSGFQGLYALRPSYNRLPFAKASMVIKGQELIPCVMGPISSTIDSLKIFFRAMSDAKPWNFDPFVIRQPWNEDAYHLIDHGGEGQQLCFAILWDDGFCKPMPPYFRALTQAKLALEAKGHKVIDWSAYGFDKSVEIMWNIFLADGGKEMNESCEESGESRIGFTNKEYAALAAKNRSTYEYWQLAKEREILVQKQLQLWQDTYSQTGTGRPVDAIICPVMATLPLPHGMNVPNSPLDYIAYCSFCNVADYVSACIPISVVDPALDKKPLPHEFRCEADKKLYEIYDPELYKGVPIGIQCVGRKNEEEAVIRMAEIIHEALNA